MYRKDYRDYIELLRARDARPSFARMEALVAVAPTRNLKAIPFFAKVFGSLIAIGVIGAAFWMLNSEAPLNETPLARSRVETNSPRYAGQPTHTKFAAHDKIRVSESAAARFQIRESIASAHTADSEPLLVSSPLPNTVTVLSPVAADPLPVAPIAIPDSEQPSNRNFFATFGGALSQQFSSNTLFRQFSFSDAFVGIGYTVSRNSSIRILGGEEVFALNQNGYYVTYHDTTFIHDGTPYPNIIGEVHTTAGSAITRVYWLGASYRYTLGDEGTPIRPFAELLAAGSTDGFLSHQSLGAEFTATSHIDFDLLFVGSELLPQNSTWLTKVGFSAELSYRF